MATAIQRAAFDAALDFARRDVRGGALPIVHHQSPADLLIDVKMRTETSRLLTWKAMHYLENGPVAAGDDEGAALARLELALAAKVYTTDAAVQSVLDAMKVVGMRSYNAEDMPFARLLNDAACLPLFDGGNVGVRRRQIQKIFAGAGYEPWAASLGA
ncbi:hypothetical protein VTK73DRAFT_1820 [Phialemonium thermophilum]|uniref:Acyl-CoA dehydrogenase/oxidase C-terminal domain-containing protein n=1 Tax=Phialemonium thermophilum TaxID=223376 RepID=A0ABR3VSX5_9PEZI